jgi:phenylacetate-CoA ligase
LGRSASLLDQLRRAVALDRLAYDPVALHRHQSAQLRRLIRHAALRVPFYRDRYRAAGVDPDAVRTIDDLSRLPHFPLLEVIEGRRVDTFVLPDGRLLHPFTLTLAMEHIPGVTRFQIVQEATDRVRVLVVPNGRAAPELITLVAGEFGRMLGPRVRIDVDAVDTIPAPAGAHWPPTVRSLIAHRQAD